MVTLRRELLSDLKQTKNGQLENKDSFSRSNCLLINREGINGWNLINAIAMKLKGSKLDWIKKYLLLYILITFPDGSIDLNISSILPHYLLRRLIKRAGIIKSLWSAGWVIASNKSIKLSTFFIEPSVQWKSRLLQNSVGFLCIILCYSGGPRLYLEDDAGCICEGTVRPDRWVNVYARLVHPILASRPGVPSYVPVPVLYLPTMRARLQDKHLPSQPLEPLMKRCRFVWTRYICCNVVYCIT